jgi:hypothetical protein
MNVSGKARGWSLGWYGRIAVGCLLASGLLLLARPAQAQVSFTGPTDPSNDGLLGGSGDDHPDGGPGSHDYCGGDAGTDVGHACEETISVP